MADEFGFVVVWPQGNMNAEFSNEPCWDFGDCCCFTGDVPLENATSPLARPPPSDIDDVGFLRQVAANVVTSLAEQGVTIDTKRLYFGGHSNGCMMCQAAAALSSDLVAAVCCHASSLMVEPSADYEPTSVHVVYGDLDYVFDFFEGGADHILNTWQAINECKENSTAVDESNLYATHTRSNCSGDTLVQTVEVFDAGHFVYLGVNPNISL